MYIKKNNDLKNIDVKKIYRKYYRNIFYLGNLIAVFLLRLTSTRFVLENFLSAEAVVEDDKEL